MNKIELINLIADDFKISKIDASEYLEALLDVLSKSFRKGKNLNISEFGKLRTFTKYIEDGRRGKFVAFSPVKKLADEVNADFNDLFATTVALLNDKSRFDLISIEELEPEEDSIIVFDDSGYEDIPVEQFIIYDEPDEEDLIESKTGEAENIVVEEVDYELESGDIIEDYELSTDETDSEIPQVTHEDEILDESFDENLIEAIKEELTFKDNVIETAAIDESLDNLTDEIVAQEEDTTAEDVLDGESPEEIDTEENQLKDETELVVISDKFNEVIPLKEEQSEVEFIDQDDLLPKNVKDDAIENIVSPPGEGISLADDLLKIIEERRRLLLESDNGDETIEESVETPEEKIEEISKEPLKLKDEGLEVSDVIDDDELEKVEAERQKFLEEQSKPKKEITNILEEYGIYRDPVEEEVEQKPKEKIESEEEKFDSILKEYGILNEENGNHDTDSETQEVVKEDDEELKIKNILEEYGIQQDQEVEEPVHEDSTKVTDEQTPEQDNIPDKYGMTLDTEEKKPEQKEITKVDDDIKIPEMDFGKIFKEGSESETEVPEEIIEEEREVVIPEDLKSLHEEISEVKQESAPVPPVTTETSYDDVFELRSETTSARRQSSGPEYNLGLKKAAEEEKDESKIFTLSFVILIVVIIIIALLTYAVFNYGLISPRNQQQTQEMIIEENENPETVIEEQVTEENQRLDLLKIDDLDDNEEIVETPVPVETPETTGQQRQLAPGEEEQIAYPEAKVVIVRTKDGFFIQVGSYSRENVAQQKINELKSKGADAFLLKSELERGTFYRVRVGGFNNLELAKSFADKNLK